MYTIMQVDWISISIFVCRLKYPVHPCPTAGGGLPTSVFRPHEEEYRVTGKEAYIHEIILKKRPKDLLTSTFSSGLPAIP
ncbi:hypothetical protein [Cognataquiflexum rubidum]|uniref:hypothetical protein n=1 Tax=Cognataquiflexum rubidum TaxID=2922273 RepID=UPI001F146122|nr:hypothetical protein [Cognataquiflexum rubidum]MCH6232448.1 hypothetical protein [Cognataquiflexum rubidum]